MTAIADAAQPRTVRGNASPPDAVTARSALARMAATGLGSGIVTLAVWLVLHATSLPAFNTSMVTRALATVGIVGTLAVTGVLLWLWLRDARLGLTMPRWRGWLTQVVAYLSPAALVMSALGLPLSATRLWLDGIQVDQTFRTQFLTRSADVMGYADMNYAGLPTYYPAGWFWLGGRLANALGMPGWEVYQPWALISLAVAGSILVPLWQRLTGSLPVATAIALMTTAVTLALGAAEPYSAVIAMGVPAIAVLCARAFHGSWLATAGIAVYLGVSATFYTLFTGAVAVTVVALIALTVTLRDRSWRPVIHLAVIGVASMAIAAIAWAPYLLASLRATYQPESAAQHYLPEEGTQIPVPFLAPSIVGLLCLIGVVYIIMRVKNPDMRTLGWALVGVYAWILGSMAFTLLGHTLLGFRLEVIVVLIMTTAGVLALVELRQRGIDKLLGQRFDAATGQRITTAFMAVLLLSGAYYAQNIPESNESSLDHAYSDTDGYGERADKFSGDAAHYYSDIQSLLEKQGFVANQSVVLTDEKLFMAYHPYHGFNAFTSHYANPLGQFTERNKQIEAWASQSFDASPEDFAQSLRQSPWQGPDIFIFRGDKDDPGRGFKTHLAEDIYPNQPNVRYRAVFFNPDAFTDSSLWDVEQVGPFVVVSRAAHT